MQLHARFDHDLSSHAGGVGHGRRPINRPGHGHPQVLRRLPLQRLGRERGPPSGDRLQRLTRPLRQPSRQQLDEVWIPPCRPWPLPEWRLEDPARHVEPHCPVGGRSLRGLPGRLQQSVGQLRQLGHRPWRVAGMAAEGDQRFKEAWHVAWKSIGTARSGATDGAASGHPDDMSKRGITLIELLLALTIIGLLALVGYPRVAGYTETLALGQARAEVVAALDAARGTAIRLGATVAVEEDGPTLVVRRLAPDTSVWWRGRHPMVHGVVLSGLDRRILFGAEGLAVGASNRTLQLRTARATRRVVISRLGRIR
jgi:prepilin-type N-terminal cleavage/methylation domain-containing protein